MEYYWEGETGVPAVIGHVGERVSASFQWYAEKAKTVQIEIGVTKTIKGLDVGVTGEAGITWNNGKGSSVTAELGPTPGVYYIIRPAILFADVYDVPYKISTVSSSGSGVSQINDGKRKEVGKLLIGGGYYAVKVPAAEKCELPGRNPLPAPPIIINGPPPPIIVNGPSK